MDLLDPNNEPITHTHTFLSSISSIRDLICWFQQCRYSRNRMAIVRKHDPETSRFSISADMNLPFLIEKFQQLKWHLAILHDNQPTRIYGNEYLDKTLEYLCLCPSAHLLAIISCPTQLQKQITIRDSNTSSSFFVDDRNQSSSNIIEAEDPTKCTVHIRMINYRNNPLYLQGKASFTKDYDPYKTTLQRIAVDFSSFCQLNITSFMLLQMYSRNTFSYPDDYLRTLSELGLSTKEVTLYCHSLAPPASSSQNHPDDHRSNEAKTDQEELSEIINQDHPKSQVIKSKVIKSKSGTNDNLFKLCFQEIFRSLKMLQLPVYRSVWRLPNNLQQALLRQLVEEQALSPTLLACFCTSGTSLTSLDLSYSPVATNEMLKVASQCAGLQEIVLDNEDHAFTNEGLWHLRACSSLRRLSLNYCTNINDWGIQVVTVLPALVSLSIRHTAVTNVGLKHIYLHLLHMEIEPNIEMRPSLRSIDLSGLAISDECLTCIGVFSHLELLNIASTGVTNPTMFPSLPELRHIDISNCRDLVWEKQIHIKSLADRFPKLSSINVRGVSNGNLVHVTMALSQCKHLRQVDGMFCHPQMTASLAASLSHLPLETVILTNCEHVTDLWLPVLARFSATLTHLVLSSCPAVVGNNNSLVNNLGRLRNLSWLDLSHLEEVSFAQIHQLIIGDFFPKLKVLWISLNEHEEAEFRLIAKNLHFKVNVTRSLANPLRIGLDLIRL